MQLPPMEVLLSWPLPNYVDPVSRGPAVLIVNIVTMSLAFLLTLLRLYTRLRITCTPGLDDIFIVVALLSLLWFCKRLIGTGAKGLYRTYYWVLIGSMVFVGICCKKSLIHFDDRFLASHSFDTVYFSD